MINDIAIIDAAVENRIGISRNIAIKPPDRGIRSRHLDFTVINVSDYIFFRWERRVHAHKATDKSVLRRNTDRHFTLVHVILEGVGSNDFANNATHLRITVPIDRNVSLVHIAFERTRIHKHTHDATNSKLFHRRNTDGALHCIIIKANPIRNGIAHQATKLEIGILVFHGFEFQIDNIVPQDSLARHHLRNKRSCNSRRADVGIFENDIVEIERIVAVVEHRPKESRIPDPAQRVVHIQVRNLVVCAIEAPFERTYRLPVANIATANRTQVQIFCQLEMQALATVFQLDALIHTAIQNGIAELKKFLNGTDGERIVL